MPAGILCPSCRHGNRPDRRFCTECGTSLVDETAAKSLEPFIHLERAELARLSDDPAARERELREAQRLVTAIRAPIRAEQVGRQLGA
jgi:hypothetical protein